MAKFSELDIEIQETLESVTYAQHDEIAEQLCCAEVWEAEYVDYLEQMCEYYNWYEYIDGEA